jgi:hypothetical protein
VNGEVMLGTVGSFKTRMIAKTTGRVDSLAPDGCVSPGKHA